MRKARLEELVVKGRTYWSIPPVDASALKAPVVDLIQGYHKCVMSCSESKDVLFGVERPGANGEPAHLHTILLNGQMIGHWKHTPRNRSVTVETAFYRRLAADELKALESAVDQGDRQFRGDPAFVKRLGVQQARSCSSRGESTWRPSSESWVARGTEGGRPLGRPGERGGQIARLVRYGAVRRPAVAEIAVRVANGRCR